jgi:hypothetical protein
VWTYICEDGWIEDSMALETAKQFGVCSELIQRAAELKDQFGSSHYTLSPLSVPQKSAERYSAPFLRELILQFLDRATPLHHHLQDRSITLVPFDFVPPPSLERSCCVYILILRGGSSQVSNPSSLLPPVRQAQKTTVQHPSHFFIGNLCRGD